MKQNPELTLTGVVMANINNCWIIDTPFGHFDIATDADINVGDWVNMSLSDSNPTINHYGVKLVLDKIYIDPLKTVKMIFKHAFFYFDIQKLLISKDGMSLHMALGSKLFSMKSGDTCTWVIEKKNQEVAE